MKQSNIIFGPIPSRRFGISLGVDLSPSKKQCNFDCLYCELDAAKTVDKMDEFPEVNEIIDAIKSSFQAHPKIDVITVTANGEPTLYPYLEELIKEINTIKKDARTLILSNGATIYKKETFDALMYFDIVKLSLDCVSKECFKKLDRNSKNIEIEKIVPAMVDFRKKFKNEFVLEILVVKDLNDKEKEVNALYEAIKEINPTRVDIGTIDRPPAYDVKPVDYNTLENIANKFLGINVNIAYRNRPKQENDFNEDEIKGLLKRRPLTKEDIDNLFSLKSKEILENLINNNHIKLVDSGGVEFYKIV